MAEWDPNVVARLVALNERTRQAWADPHNDRYYTPASFRGFLVRDGKSREPTPFSDDSDNDGHVEDTEPELRLCFNKNLPKNMSQGWTFGSDKTACDIYCGEHDKKQKYNIGSQTFSITISEQGNVVLKHLKDTNRTTVQYGSQKAGDRREFVWIMFPDCEKIVVTTAKLLKFRVIVAEPSAQTKVYRGLRARFVKGIENSIPSMPLLSVDCGTTTADSSLVSTPERNPFYYVRKDHVLGMGSFGKVYIVVDASTGVEYAGKTFIGEIDYREILTLAVQDHVSHILFFAFLTGCVWHFKTTRDELWKSFAFELMVSIGKHPQICMVVP